MMGQALELITLSMGSTSHLLKNFDIGGQPGTNKVTSFEPIDEFAAICKKTGCGGSAGTNARPAAAAEESKKPQPTQASSTANPAADDSEQD